MALTPIQIGDTGEEAKNKINLGLGETDLNTIFREGASNPDTVDFNPAIVIPPTYLEARMYYDNVEKALAYYNDESEIVLHVDREMIMRVFNDSGGTISKGKVVTVINTVGGTGDNAGVPIVQLAIASIKVSALNVVGISKHDIPDESYGYISTRGFVKDLDTSGLTAGGLTYLSATVAGEVTTIRPPSPAWEVKMGGVAKADVAEGILYVEPIVLNNTSDGLKFFNGAILESHHIVTESDGTNVSVAIHNSDEVSNLSIMFDAEFNVFDAPSSVNITPGTDELPIRNFVYIPKSTNLLTANTTGFPTTEQYAPVADIMCQSAISVQVGGAYKVHAWTDHLSDSVKQGHLAHINEWIRNRPAQWKSGSILTPSLVEGVSGVILDLSFTQGIVYQLHKHAVKAFDTSISDVVFVINDSVTKYNSIPNLNSVGLGLDSLGGTLNNKYYNVVLWATVSEDLKDCQLMLNLPNGSYSNASSALADLNNTANFDIPQEYLGVGFLHTQLVLKNGSSVIEIVVGGTKDLRGKVIGGGGSSTSGGGAVNLVDLLDTPSDYIGHALKALAVNSGESGTEFVPITSIERAYPTVISNSLAINFNNKNNYKTTNEVTANANFSIVLSNYLNTENALIDLRITNTVVISLPANSLMQESEDRYVSGNEELTIEGGIGSSFELSLNKVETGTGTSLKWILSDKFI